MEVIVANTTFQGPVRSLNGFYSFGPGNVVNIANNTNTLSLTVADHAGRILRTNDATLVLTLPTINASTNPNQDTPNNIGTEFCVFVETAATALVVQTDSTDKFVGSLSLIDTDGASGAMFGYAPASTNDVLTLNGTTQGGIAGSWVKFTALATAKWLVSGVVLGSGTPATMFSDT
jgi:hypothetical protein